MVKVYPKEFIEGKRIILRRHELSLATEMFELVDRDRARLSKFLPWVDQITEVKDEENFIRSAFMEWEDFSRFGYGIFTKNPHRYLGNVGVHSISWEDGCCEIGYWISSEGEGQGYVSEAVSLLERELFERGFFRIEIRCDSDNNKSSAVPRRSGFTHEGTLRLDKVRGGKRRNTMIWAKLRTDK